MARFEFSGDEFIEAQLGQLDRDMIRNIVMSGAEACKADLQNAIGQYHHVKTGSMQRSVAAGRYHEDLNSGYVEVYPQGYDARGVSNAKKAFVINYGYGGRKTQKTGDKFITGNKKKTELVVSKAMQEESDRLISMINRGG